MANAIELAKSYVPKLDEVYKLAALTSVLDSDGAELKEGANAGEFIIPKMSMDGLGAYDRNNGYAQGSVTMENETVMVQDAGVDANPDTMIAVDKAIKEQLDHAFGAEVSPVFFGGMSSLALCEDGELVLEKVMEAVVPIFEDATGKAVAASNARKAQRLEKYRDKRVGLAPGQQI